MAWGLVNYSPRIYPHETSASSLKNVSNSALGNLFVAKEIHV